MMPEMFLQEVGLLVLEVAFGQELSGEVVQPCGRTGCIGVEIVAWHDVAKMLVPTTVVRIRVGSPMTWLHARRREATL